MPDQSPPVRWEPDRAPAEAASAEAGWTVPELPVALGRGVRCLCPACGQARAFNGYLSVVPECPSCGAPLGRYRADDAPPYFTVLIVGHLTVPLMFWVDSAFKPSVWLEAAIWLPVVALLTVGLLRPVKGAVLGWMMRLGLMKNED